MSKNREQEQKEEERKILFTAMSRDIIEPGLEENETPDFIITNQKNGLKMGVEIAESYLSQGTAHLQKDMVKDWFINAFKSDTKDNPKVPEHLKKINVAKVIGGEGKIKHCHAIWYIAKATDYFDFLDGLISKKNKSYSEKIEDLEFVTLITRDKDNFFKYGKSGPEDLYGILREHNLFKTVIKSNFQEIILITEFPSGLYAIPLRWLIFHSEYALFGKFWSEIDFINDEQRKNIITRLESFLVCLIHMGFRDIYMFQNHKYRYLIVGTKKWKIDEGSSTINEDGFLALPLPEENEMRRILKNHENYKALFMRYMNYRQSIVPHLNPDFFAKLS